MSAIGGINGGAFSPGLSSLRADPTLDQQQTDFAELLSTAERRIASGERDAGAEARDAAERFVAQALVQPMLDLTRETSEAAPPFHPTRGEKQFRSLMDAQVALDVVRRSDWDVVDRIARDLLARGGAVEMQA